VLKSADQVHLEAVIVGTGWRLCAVFVVAFLRLLARSGFDVRSARLTPLASSSHCSVAPRAY
jgi:hypothetical protein